MLSKVVFALLLAVTLGFPTERVSNHIEKKINSQVIYKDA
jgi:hypothetical protein